jgi:periplasmic copper chaperone A
LTGLGLRLRRSLVIGGALVGAAVLAAPLAWTAEILTVENAWVPLAPAAVKVHAAYMTVVNPTDAEEHIVAAESPDYERVELHESIVEGGRNEMRAVDQVTVPAHGRIAFAPAGLHFMLVGPRRTPALDGQIRIVLRLRGGEQVEVSAVVRRREGAGQLDHHHHGESR